VLFRSSATVHVIPAQPSGLTAALTANASSIALNWTANPEADSYVIQRSFNHGAYVDYGTSSGAAFSDNDSQFASRGVVTYLYRVITVVAGERSLPSAPAMATRVIFVEPVIVPGVTLIKGIHVAQLREAIDAVRVSAGLARIWNTTDYQGTFGFVEAWQFYESNPSFPARDLFNALNQARDVIPLPRIAFPAGTTPPAAGGVIYAQHVLSLRGGLQ